MNTTEKVYKVTLSAYVKLTDKALEYYSENAYPQTIEFLSENGDLNFEDVTSANIHPNRIQDIGGDFEEEEEEEEEDNYEQE